MVLVSKWTGGVTNWELIGVRLFALNVRSSFYSNFREDWTTKLISDISNSKIIWFLQKINFYPKEDIARNVNEVISGN